MTANVTSAEAGVTSSRAGPPVQALGESLAALAAEVADLRSRVALISQRLDRAGIRDDVDLVARFEELAGTVATALDAVAPRGPAAPCWIGLDHDIYHARLAELRRWADTVTGSSCADLGASAAAQELLYVTGCARRSDTYPPTSVYDPVHGSPSTGIKPAGGAGGARTHDRRIMRSTARCSGCATCTDTTESCRRWR